MMDINEFRALTYAEMTDEQREMFTQGLCSGIHEVMPKDMDFLVICVGQDTGLINISSSLTPKTCPHCKTIIINVLDIAKESVMEM